MTTSKRLDKARTRLTPKQIVLLMVKEAHAARSPLTYAKRMLREGAEGTICGKIERSIMGEALTKRTGRSDEMVQTIRDAQREGVFLFGLAARCWEAVMAAREALDLRWMLWNLSLKAQGSSQDWAAGTTFEGSESPLTLERIGSELRRLRDDVLALKGAVELIEKRYFGMPVLFPHDREWLEEMATRSVEFLDALDKGLHAKRPCPIRTDGDTAPRGPERELLAGAVDRGA